jgi:Transposase and inactivated derivatives
MMRITFNGEQVNFAINHRIPQKYWNAKLSKSSKGYEGSKELNRFLQDLQFRAFDAFTTLEREEDDFTAKRIHDVMNGIGVESSRYILDGLSGDESIAAICRREGIAQSVYYSWSKAFMDAGKARLNGDTKREADSGEVAEMRKQNGELKEALAEEILRNRFLKKLSKGME